MGQADYLCLLIACMRDKFINIDMEYSGLEIFSYLLTVRLRGGNTLLLRDGRTLIEFIFECFMVKVTRQKDADSAS